MQLRSVHFTECKLCFSKQHVIYVCVYIQIYLCLYISVCIYVYVHICVYKYVHMCVYIRVCALLSQEKIGMRTAGTTVFWYKPLNTIVLYQYCTCTAFII